MFSERCNLRNLYGSVLVAGFSITVAAVFGLAAIEIASDVSEAHFLPYLQQ